MKRRQKTSITVGGRTPSRTRSHSKSDTMSGKQSLYFPQDLIEEIHTESVRLDRSLSWIVQRAWKIARQQIRALPSDVDTSE